MESIGDGSPMGSAAAPQTIDDRGTHRENHGDDSF